MKTIIGFVIFMLVCGQALSADKDNSICDGRVGADYATCQSTLELLLQGSSQSRGAGIFAIYKERKWLFRYEISEISNEKHQCIVTINHLLIQKGRKTRLLYTSHDHMVDLHIDKLGIRKTAIPGRVDEIMINATSLLEEGTVKFPPQDRGASDAVVVVDMLSLLAYKGWILKAHKQDCHTIE
ncbi:hypothetical protein [Rhizobium oryziradicis]|uniref:Cytochrome oxidase subunit II copper A binding domain-containing protein n=1 Tax=Rhizobium oryziradicis TaxID=1867956 RepID=A0A1Q8ZYC0_9HYPH|nr:hypothetical protein [Rhizobium oryziradicis]OLP47035.1 hypothetical protein BJF95_02370 [Rhizobium oryziradicis]